MGADGSLGAAGPLTPWPDLLGYHLALTQEPWCFTPEQVARVSFVQARELYWRPAAERAERLRREAAGEPEERSNPLDRGLPSKEAFVAAMEADFPGAKTRGQWEADWERLKLEIEAYEAKKGV